MLTRINTEALHHYVREFTQIVCDKLYADNSLITGEQLFVVTPVAQINLLLVSELYDKWKIETMALRSPFFDFEHERIKELLAQLVRALSEHISITRANFEPLLYDATYQTLRLLLDPKEYFSGVYKAQSDLSVKKTLIEQQQKYLRINAFIPQKIAETMADESFVYATEAIEVTEKTIDQQPELLEDKEPWLSMFAEILPVPTTEIVKQFPSADVHSLSFFDKAIHSIDELLAKYRQGINNSLAAAAPAPTATTTPAEEGASATKNTEIEDSNIAVEPELSVPQTQTPSVTIIEQPLKEPKVSTMAMMQMPATETDDEPTDTTHHTHTPEVSEVLLQSKANHTRKTPIVSLSTGVPLHQKFLFIQELFGGSPTEYEYIVEELDNTPDYAAARELLNFKYASKYMWDMSSDTVAELAEFVKRRFDES
jgi:hypothetical protein